MKRPASIIGAIGFEVFLELSKRGNFLQIIGILFIQFLTVSIFQTKEQQCVSISQQPNIPHGIVLLKT